VAGVPDLLTVEEAARLIRVGRTKAYAMAQEWRTTNGCSGLPVVDFGHVLRVPRKALEQIIGAELARLRAIPQLTEHRTSGDQTSAGAGAKPCSNATRNAFHAR
jgi:hypothetical protein